MSVDWFKKAKEYAAEVDAGRAKCVDLERQLAEAEQQRDAFWESRDAAEQRAEHAEVLRREALAYTDMLIKRLGEHSSGDACLPACIGAPAELIRAALASLPATQPYSLPSVCAKCGAEHFVGRSHECVADRQEAGE